MTKREIANLCCKILAIYALIQGISQISLVLALGNPLIDEEPWKTVEVAQQVLWATIPVMWVTMGVFVWRWSWLIAAWIVGYDIQDHPSEPDAARHTASTTEMQAVAFSVVGLWVLVQTIPTGLGYIAQILYMRSVDGSGVGAGAFQSAAWMEISAKLVLGTWLLFGASGLVRLLRSMRDIGREKGSQEPAA